MGDKAERQKDLAEARAMRSAREAEKKSAAIRMLGDGRGVREVASRVGATRATVQRWKEEMGNG